MERNALTSVLPKQWKTSLINPISKVNKPFDFRDIRPISILSVLLIYRLNKCFKSG